MTTTPKKPVAKRPAREPTVKSPMLRKACNVLGFYPGDTDALIQLDREVSAHYARAHYARD